MAELTIRLEIDPQTGAKTLVVDYHSDPDSLPMEHDEEHARLLEALIGQGVIGAGEAVAVRVERAGAAAPAARATQERDAPRAEALEEDA